MVELLALLLNTLQVQSSNLGPETGILTGIFHGFPQFLQENAE
jgi:hypothetical protein